MNFLLYVRNELVNRGPQKEKKKKKNKEKLEIRVPSFYGAFSDLECNTLSSGNTAAEFIKETLLLIVCKDSIRFSYPAAFMALVGRIQNNN